HPSNSEEQVDHVAPTTESTPATSPRPAAPSPTDRTMSRTLAPMPFAVHTKRRVPRYAMRSYLPRHFNQRHSSERWTSAQRAERPEDGPAGASEASHPVTFRVRGGAGPQLSLG